MTQSDKQLSFLARAFNAPVYALIILLLAALGLAGCTPSAGEKAPENQPDSDTTTKVYVMGMLHGTHRRSERYSLDVVRKAVDAIKPDIILTELPKARYQQALDEFARSGKVSEKRARAFPEYVDAIIPMGVIFKYRIIGTAAWTPEIAEQRKEAFEKIEADPARKGQWDKYQAAIKQFSQTLAGRGDDPLYIHSEDYDKAVKARYQPYIRYFDRDMGDAGWEKINAAHWANIAEQLDLLKGRGKTVLITYGAFHKYQILQHLKQRDDVRIMDIRPKFAEISQDDGT